MRVKINITEQDLKYLIKDFIESKINTNIDQSKINIMVKSKQNYKSEWENASFKAEYEHKID